MFELTSDNITAIIAIAAIFSPLITAVINGMFSMWNKKIDNKQRRYDTEFVHVRTILENYSQSLEAYLLDGSYIDRKKTYQQAYSLALIYVSDSLRHEMIDINDFIANHNFKLASEKAYLLIPQIADYITKLNK